MPVIWGIACYCSKVFSSSVRLLSFYPSSMPLDVGPSEIISAPVNCWCVFNVHVVEIHTPFPKPFHKPKESVEEKGKKKKKKLTNHKP